MRRRFLYLGASALLAAALGAFSGGGARAAHIGAVEAGSQRPNVVVIETDDQTVEQMRVLKNTLRLIGQQGETFDNNFVSLSLCCPSRATFLTGQYAHNHGVLSNAAPDGGFLKLDSRETLPVWLSRAGYRTAFVGKYLNGYVKRYREVPPGWDDWHAAVTLSYFNYKMNDNGKIHHYGDDPTDYQTDVFTHKAVNEVNALASGRQPFFLWLSYFAPHSGPPADADDPPGIGTPHPAPWYQNAFKNEGLPVTPAFNQADVSTMPLAIQDRPPLTPDTIGGIREMYQQQLESLLSVDDGVQSIVDALDAAGQLGKTYIFFTDDNGYFHGEHRVPSGKVLLYEPSIRVPLLARGPGIPHGVHVSQLVGNIDLAPTILDLTGAQAKGRVLDGRSLVPLFRDPTTQWDRALLIERLPLAIDDTGRSRRPITHPNGGDIGYGDGGNIGRAGSPNDQPFGAIRTNRYMYAEYSDGERELYDLKLDPFELESVHADPAYASVEQELSRRLAKLRTCQGQKCRSVSFP